MTTMPRPWVELDGTRVYCRADRFDAGTTVLDDLAINWGREHPMAERTATAATFTLWDADGYWLRRAAIESIVGVDVVLGWDADPPAVAHPTQLPTRIIFRGKVAGVDITRSRRPVSARTTERGWFVEVTATDPTTDLGNVKYADNTSWPPESAILRANRLKDEIRAAGVDIAEVYFEPDTVTWPMGRTDTSSKSLLDLLGEFYQSFGLAWDYRPDENVTRPAPIIADVTNSYLYWLPGTADHVLAGGFVNLSGFGADSVDYLWSAIRGCDVGVDDAPLALDRSNRINWIDLDYQRADGSTFRTAGYRRDNVRRTTKTETWLNLDAPNQSNSARPFTHTWEYIDSATLPQHPTITWDTHHTNGFDNVGQAFVLTRATQAWSLVHVSGNPYPAALDVGSDMQIIGGVVRYVGQRWIVEMRPAWPGRPAWWSVPWSTLSTNEAAADLTWNSPAGRFDRSICWSDLRAIVDEQTQSIELR